MCDLLATGVREAYVQHCLSVVFGHLHRPVDLLQYVLTDQIAITQDLDRRSVSLEQLSVRTHLHQLRLSHVHERIDLPPATLEVLNAESIDGHTLDTAFVADFEDLCESFESQVVALDGLEFARTGVAAVSVHYKGDVLGYRAALKRANEEVSKVCDCALDWRQGECPAA